MANQDYKTQLNNLLDLTIKEGASDLHISVNNYPTLRIVGKLVPIMKMKKLTPTDTQGLALALLTETQYQKLLEKKEIDFSYNFQDKARFRVNAYFQRGTISIALRLIPQKIRTIEELNLPSILHKFTQPQQGFILITGPSGHGKSTTLAALIDEINHTRTEHIITIEDPIEYVFEEDKSIIDQREVLHDTLSFTNALKATFRQDPDVIMVGEMRDAESMEIALRAAETGHLVFSTLHTNSASQTIHRVVSAFPIEHQEQIRAQLASALYGIISQRLIPRTSGGLIPACEVMFNTPAIANLIRENKIHEIDFVIETSLEEGMISFNRALAELVRKGEISLNNALAYSLDPKSLRKLMKK